MRATNHVLTGSVFALAVAGEISPVVILPAAFFLHFVLDALPHWGERDESKWNDDLSRQRWILPIDAAGGALVLIILAVAQPEYWQLAFAAGALCASPDLLSIGRFRRFLRNGDVSYGDNRFNRWHHNIQWGERPWGIWLELAWALVFGYLLYQNL